MAGPWYFAWVDVDETEFAPEHIRLDEQVLNVRIEHNEGDFASLELEVVNPKIGFLAPGRKVWAYLAFDKGGEDNIVPVFFGRLVGVPDDLEEETVTLSFVARPADYTEQKEVVAASLKVRPYWDPIWFDPDTRDNPDNVLESRPELWHIDRVTLAVTTSHILLGEDGVISLTEDDVLYESLHMSYSQTPLTRVDVLASVSWNQYWNGAIDISSKFNFGAPNSILTYTGDGLVKSWPKTGANLRGGWNVVEGSATRVDGIGNAIWGYGLRNNKGAAGPGANPFGRSYIASEDWHDVIVPSWAVASSFSVSGGGSGINQTFPAHTLGIPRWRLVPVLRVGFETTRARTEQLAFSLSADVQSILTDPGDDAVELLSFSSSELTSDVDPSDDSGGFRMALAGRYARAYLNTDRGAQSIEYLIALARSHLLARARCVEITFEIPFLTGIDLELSCRKDVNVTDYRLPGGTAAGKIMSYSFTYDGDTGTSTCEIRIGCSIGKGNTVSAVAGDPLYVEDGYVAVDYQQYENQYVMPIAGEVTYLSQNGVSPNDDGIDLNLLTPDRVVLDLVKENDHFTQAAAMGSSAEEPNDVFERLNSVPTRFKLELLPLDGGPFQTNYIVPTSLLSVPKTIDLEAPAS